MGNTNSSKQTKTTTKTTDDQWRRDIKKNLIKNNYLYFSYEIYDEMTYNSGLTEIRRENFLNILKSTLEELKLNYFITISRTKKPIHYYIDVSIINSNMKQIQKKKTILINDNNSIDVDSISEIQAEPLGEFPNAYPIYSQPVYPPPLYPPSGYQQPNYQSFYYTNPSTSNI